MHAVWRWVMHCANHIYVHTCIITNSLYKLCISKTVMTANWYSDGIYVIQLFMDYWHHMAAQIWVSMDSGNGLLPDGTKPLSEPMLTHKVLWDLPCANTLRYDKYEDHTFKIAATSPRGQCVNTSQIITKLPIIYYACNMICWILLEFPIPTCFIWAIVDDENVCIQFGAVKKFSWKIFMKDTP